MTKIDKGPPLDAAYWHTVHANDYAVPHDADLSTLTDELARALKDPDPEVRDGIPYVVLRTWIERDVIGRELRAGLGTVMADRFTDHEIQARTFAPLVLDMIVGRGDFDPGWLAAFRRWYPAEADLRGYDPELGWLHAVAHGADLLGTFALHPAVDPTTMLALASDRLLAPTDQIYAQQEDDRLAQAIARALTRPELSEAESVEWLAPIEADFAVGRPPGVPTTAAHTSNAMRTLRMLYLLADVGVRTRPSGPVVRPLHADALQQRLARVLALVFQSH
ncbi:DUF2785 domain-containing protein [Streptomyces sp. V2I9]|uniref:DUF2785 domain-containing protein n=1 Tax=Streptomyces sp. V2I9 TaxID=3042304 RepID=UPI00277D8C1A|nr:DUF2785 domain-containing protein [Streptomyces sp. V2I9]MDQ0988227.1 hypothetical protein [Streptomyces sp. V2I9]